MRSLRVLGARRSVDSTQAFLFAVLLRGICVAPFGGRNRARNPGTAARPPTVGGRLPVHTLWCRKRSPIWGRMWRCCGAVGRTGIGHRFRSIWGAAFATLVGTPGVRARTVRFRAHVCARVCARACVCDCVWVCGHVVLFAFTLRCVFLFSCADAFAICRELREQDVSSWWCCGQCCLLCALFLRTSCQIGLQ